MKRVIGIVFLSVLFMQVAGSYFYFITRLINIRVEMREQLKHLPDEQLTQLTFTPQEFKAAKEDDHEIEVNGKMYDIARVVIQGEKVLVYALHDEAEDNLLTFLDEIVKRSSKDKKPVPSQLIQLLSLQSILIYQSMLKPVGQHIVHITHYKNSISSFQPGIESPPPRG